MRIVNKKEAAKYEADIAKIDADIVAARSAMKTKAAELEQATDEATKTLLRAEIDELSRVSSRDVVAETRRIMATAFTSGRVNRYRETLGMKPMFEDEAQILAEHLLYGNLENSVSLISEGGFNFETGIGQFVQVFCNAFTHNRYHSHICAMLIPFRNHKRCDLVVECLTDPHFLVFAFKVKGLHPMDGITHALQDFKGCPFHIHFASPNRAFNHCEQFPTRDSLHLNPVGVGVEVVVGTVKERW